MTVQHSNTVVSLRLKLAACLFCSLFFVGWGGPGHTIINTRGGGNCTDSTIVNAAQLNIIIANASAADRRSGAEPKHFMDMEKIDGFATQTISHDVRQLFQTYGEKYMRSTVGILPWVIDSVTKALTSQMQARNWTAVWNTAADLGHYVGDAHQPLHTTVFYNGDSSRYGKGSLGLHSRYESDMVGAFLSSITVTPGPVKYIASPLDEAFAIMYQANVYVDSILIADYTARTTSGTYTTLLWQGCSGFTIRQFQRASDAFGSYLYTAWVNAGRPATPVEREPAAPATAALLTNFPNPFNPSTTVQFRLAAAGRVSVKVFDMAGREIATLANGLYTAGSHSVRFDGSTYASGAYVVWMKTEGAVPGVLTRKILLVR